MFGTFSEDRSSYTYPCLLVFHYFFPKGGVDPPSTEASGSVARYSRPCSTRDIHQITTERRTCRGSNTLHGSSYPAFVSPLASIASACEKKKMVRAANDMRCVREQQSQRCVRENALAAVINRRRCSGGQRSALMLMTWLIRLLGGQYYGGAL